MKITFYSNFLNHHQLPFCMEMYRLLGDGFVFVATERIDQERLDLGYHDMNKIYPFVLTTYDSDQNKQKAVKLALESDAIITGSAPEEYTKMRIGQNKLTFRYSERIYKKGIIRALSPRGILNIYKNHTYYKNKQLYMLCASAYTSGDFAITGAYMGKTYKWGYFPEVIPQDIEDLLNSKDQEKTEILWCGRMLDWKHPEKAVLLAKELRDKGYKFHLNLIGCGEQKNKIIRMVSAESLCAYVSLLGSMPPEDVRKYMEKANIFIQTSDYNEGWGAVMNEAMNSGCAIVASHAVGSVPFLIKHGKNGLIYKNSSLHDFFTQVETLLQNKAFQKILGKNAYDTVQSIWNAEIAAKKLIRLIELLIFGTGDIQVEGPCSSARPIMQWKMYRECMR